MSARQRPALTRFCLWEMQSPHRAPARLRLWDMQCLHRVPACKVAMSASSSSAAPPVLGATGLVYTDSVDAQSNVYVEFQHGSACARRNWSSGYTDSVDAQSGSASGSWESSGGSTDISRCVQSCAGEQTCSTLADVQKATSCCGGSTGTCTRQSEIA